MGSGRLTALQGQVVEILQDFDPAWTLTGGGALAAVHLQHRATRDLDLFWHGRRLLDRLPEEVEERLVSAGLQVARLQRTPAFARLLVTGSGEQVVLDLVAEPVPYVEEPERARIGRAEVWIDTPHEILVNKLCSLLGRAELRDLVDVRALLQWGADFERAVADAPEKDSGFSALTLAWVLEQLDVRGLGRSEGLPNSDLDELVAYQNELIGRLTEGAQPE